MTRTWELPIKPENLDDILVRGKAVEVRALPTLEELTPERDYRLMRAGHGLVFVENVVGGEPRRVRTVLEAVRAYFSFEQLYEWEGLRLTEPRLKTVEDALEENRRIPNYVRRVAFWNAQDEAGAYALEFRRADPDPRAA